MTLFARILRFLFWLLVISWGVALVRRFLAGTSSKPSGSGDVPGKHRDARESPRKLVRDPVCGMHVAEEMALPLQQGDELLHFCSPECRDRYLSQTQRKAANG